MSESAPVGVVGPTVPNQSTPNETTPTAPANPMIPPPIATTDAPIGDAQPVPVLGDLQPRKRRTRRKAGEPKAEKPPKAPKAPKAPKEPRIRKGTNAGRKVGTSVNFKDWVKVVRSSRNEAANERIHLVIDDVNMVCTIVTQARLQADQPELEPEKKQYVKITSFEVVHGQVQPVLDPATQPPTPDVQPQPVNIQGSLPFAPPS